MAINFRGRANVKYFMETQLLRFYKDTAKAFSLSLLKVTTKSTNFLPAKKKILILCGLNYKQIKYKRSQNLTSKHQMVKNFQIVKTFLKNLNKEAT